MVGRVMAQTIFLFVKTGKQFAKAQPAQEIIKINKQGRT
jgi:hypothetical protein